MQLLKQMCSSSFGREAAVFFQLCHILNLCVGSPVFLRGVGKKGRIRGLVVCQKGLCVTCSCSGGSRAPEYDHSLWFVLCCCEHHTERSHHPGTQHGVTACCCMPCMA